MLSHCICQVYSPHYWLNSEKISDFGIAGSILWRGEISPWQFTSGFKSNGYLSLRRSQSLAEKYVITSNNPAVRLGGSSAESKNNPFW